MRNSFKKLLESVQKQSPELITEEIFNDMMTQFDDGIAQLQADATADGQAIGFREGYDEGKRVAGEQAKAELDAKIAELDAEAAEKLNSILAMIDDNHTAKLQELYDYMANNMVTTDAMNAELAKQDEDFANKFETAIDAVCDDHACKLQTFKEAVEAKHADEIKVIKESIDKKYQGLLEESVKAIDENNTKKLGEVVALLKEDKEKAVKTIAEAKDVEYTEKLEHANLVFESKLAEANNALKAEQSRKLSILAEGVEKYLNYALEQHLPKKQLISEAKYSAAIKTLDKVTDLLKVHSIIQESKDGIFAEYEAKLAEAKEEAKRLVNESIELKSQLDKKEAQLLLESKAQKCTPAEARFLRGYFKDATSPKIIEESIDTAHAAWKKIQSEQRQLLQESVKKEVNKKPSEVVTEAKEKTAVKESVKQVISESKEVVEKSIKSDQDLVDFYAGVLK